MSSNSAIEYKGGVNNEIEELDNLYENDIEEIEVGSSETEDQDPNVVVGRIKKKVKNKLTEKESKVTLCKLYECLQMVITCKDEVSANRWKRSRLLAQSIRVCKDLFEKYNLLRKEQEELLQEHWKLMRHAAKLKKRKKKNQVCSIRTRSSSRTSLRNSKDMSPEKHSTDEAKIDPLSTCEPMTVDKQEEEEKEKQTPDVNQNQYKPRLKKRTGISSEEKEFSKLEEKIDRLAFEVDKLWNEINYDDDDGDDEDDNEYDSPETFPGTQNEPSLEHEHIVDGNLLYDDCTIENREENVLPETNKPVQLISVKSITKLLEPQFVKDCQEIIQSNKTLPSPTSVEDNSCPNTIENSNPSSAHNARDYPLYVNLTNTPSVVTEESNKEMDDTPNRTEVISIEDSSSDDDSVVFIE